MQIVYLKNTLKKTLAPFENYSERLGDFPLAGTTLSLLQEKRLKEILSKFGNAEIKIRSDFWPSRNILNEIAKNLGGIIVEENSSVLFEVKGSEAKLKIDKDSLIITYPWDFIKINEESIAELSETYIYGTVRTGATIDGKIILGEGSVILPGVYIEGNAVIGKNSKIGPNCYIRGNTYIGDECHIGQAVELKNSLIMNKVSIGHLSYIGDSIIGTKTNFGAGTITANLRHDGKNHKCLVESDFIDTGRRKLGVIVGEEVHTGINTTIYPGRKIYSYASTLPGEIVKNDKR
ncbi:MAG TPA: hypothetical protein DD381_11785 [Lentisphaeria bacterium]|nr:MAG: hypothetical protein A2X47_02650 [Lentisphaerae bacterium GWF2_38_69]HBM17006.1 hypothetical protein [Lentisphaeria bacterium]